MGDLDRERVLIKIDELESYMREVELILPASFEEYSKVEKKRACERVLQLVIETTIDICHLLVTELRLGLPAEEDDLFGKLASAGVVTKAMEDTLRSMKGLRNVLVHEYAKVDDDLVYKAMTTRMKDFRLFAEEIRTFLRFRA